MTAAGWIAIIIVGLVVAWLIQAYVVKKKYPGGIWLALVVGLVGAWIGGSFLGTWGWMLGGANVIASILGAGILAWIVGLFGREEKA